MRERLDLVLDDGPAGGALALTLDIESVSESGVAVLSTDEAPAEVDVRVLGGRFQDRGPLRFRYGRRELEGSIVWLELPHVAGPRRVELIVDGRGPGWSEIHGSLAAKN